MFIEHNRGARWSSGRASEPELRGSWFDPQTGYLVLSLRKIIHSLTRVLVITLEALAPFRHGCKVVDRDVKP